MNVFRLYIFNHLHFLQSQHHWDQPTQDHWIQKFNFINLVPCKYLSVCFAAYQCSFLGLDWYLRTDPIAWKISGFVLVRVYMRLFNGCGRGHLIFLAFLGTYPYSDFILWRQVCYKTVIFRVKPLEHLTQISFFIHI